MTAYILTTDPVALVSDPETVAHHIIRAGTDRGLPDGESTPQVLILDGDDEPVWTLDPAQALAIAEKLRDLARAILDIKPLRRRPETDDALRELDD